MGLSAKTNKQAILIPTQPSCAVVNITGISGIPEQKDTSVRAWMEVDAGNGIRFKKRVIIKLNGETSIAKPKRNFSALFCEDEWAGHKTTSIKIGDWVAQDGFHFKAFYTSITKGETPVCYKLYQKILETKPQTRRAPFMDYYSEDEIIDIFNSKDQKQKEAFSARCFPDGFPCIINMNGQFYGIYSWQLKKHRGNYHLGRNKTDNIHLDGYLGTSEIWSGKIRWDKFKIRNPHPKNDKWTLLCQDGTPYDGDHPAELMGTDSPLYDSKNESCRKSAETKAHIVALSKYMSEIRTYEKAYNKATDNDKAAALQTLRKEIEKRFSMEWMIDYLILQVFIQNGDAIRKNWQWTTWGDIDGTVRWYVNPYDLDFAFGIVSTTGFVTKEPTKPFYGKDTNTPARYVWDYYLDDMKSRYAQLRKSGVLSHDTVWELMKDWTDRVGAGNYAKEAQRWPEMPCNRDSHISPDWTYTNVSYIAFYDKYGSKDWRSTKTYYKGAYTRYKGRCYQAIKDNVGHEPDEKFSQWWEDVTIKPGLYKRGDKIFDGQCNFFEFRATKDIVVSEDSNNNSRQDHLTGAPFTMFYSSYPHEGGTHDRPDRIKRWLKDKIRQMDKQMDYRDSSN